jgi:hypothetical protein
VTLVAHSEFNGIAGQKAQRIPDVLGDRDLTLDRDRCRHRHTSVLLGQ